MSQLVNAALRALLRHPEAFPPCALCVKNLGLRNYLRLVSADRERFRRKPGELFSLTSRYARHPVYCRQGTSDFQVFIQIFVEREYSCVDDLREIRTIIDCGANVGYSTAYFLTRFPRAKIVSVEPDPENFGMLRRNVQPYGERVQPVSSGVWSHPATLRMSDKPYRDGQAWSQQVCECGPNESGFQAVDMNQLIAMSDAPRIDLLKMDIEGAEAVVFSKNVDSWLDRIETLVIELHEDSMFGNGRQVVKRVMAERGFTEQEFQELSIFRRRSRLGVT
jgi:FkbM family methyltransferase